MSAETNGGLGSASVPPVSVSTEPHEGSSAPTDAVSASSAPVLEGAKARRTRRRYKPVVLLAFLWLAVIVIMTVAAPWIAPFEANQQDLTQALTGPSSEHLLGTDSLGRDLLSRLLFGGRVTLIGVVIATVVAITVGGAIGLLAGYLGRAVDSTTSAVAEMLMSIPTIAILLSIAAVTSRNITILMFVVGVLLSASVFRVFRAATLELRQELFVTAARTSGLTDFGILWRHIFPRLGAMVFIQAAIVASLALVVQVGLGFLNIDVKPPDPSWGNMVASASQTLYSGAWPMIVPGLAIVLTVVAFSLIGDFAQQTRTAHGRQIGLGGKVARSSTPTSTPPAAKQLPGSQRESDTPDTPNFLTLDDVSLSVPTPSGGTVLLIDGVSINVRPGEIVGLVGESGAGKSVTARSVLGIAAGNAQVSGSIRYRGRELLGADESDLAKVRGKEIAFIGQDPMVSLSPTIRVGTQLAEAVRTHRNLSRKEAKTIALELLAQVRIPDPQAAAELYPHQISGGMAQRVVIAMALAGEPSVIIADEPTTALDVSVQMQILDLLRSLQRERSLAMLLVTHDWGVVADVCDRAVVMYAGQVVEQASVADIFNRSLHPYSAALRAADPHSQRPGVKLVTIAGQVPPPGDWPTGCRFAARCDYATAACTSGPVSLSSPSAGRQVRCVRVNEIGVHRD